MIGLMRGDTTYRAPTITKKITVNGVQALDPGHLRRRASVVAMASAANT